MTRHRGGVVAVTVVLAMALLACAPVDPLGRPSAAGARGAVPLHPPAGQLRRAARRRPNSTRPAPALRRAHAAARPRDRRRHRPRLPPRELRAGRRRPTRSRPAGPGTTILYDAYGVPHITGRTRADLAFGAGWVTARDRGLLLQLGRGPARVAVADVPGINAFGLVTSAQSFVPSAATEQLVTDQVQLIIDTYGDKGREMIADMQAEADGITAYNQAHGVNQPPATVNDVIAVTAFIGSIFGAGGGAEASNAEFLATLRNHLGGDGRPQGVARRDALRRPRGADHADAALRLRTAHRRPDHRVGRDRRELDRLARPAPACGAGRGRDDRRDRDGRGRVTRGRRAGDPVGRRAHLPGRRSGAVQAGVELPRRGPEALGRAATRSR